MAIKKPVHEIRGDFVLQSKHADAAFQGKPLVSDERAIFFLDTPKKGKCLEVEFNSQNYPAMVVIIQANWKARKKIMALRKDIEHFDEEAF